MMYSKIKATFIDGFPSQVGGIVGYINNLRGLTHRLYRPILPNIEWIEFVLGLERYHPLLMHVVVTIAIRTIGVEDKILIDYS